MWGFECPTVSDHVLNILFKHPILPRDAEALERVQEPVLKFVKGLVCMYLLIGKGKSAKKDQIAAKIE